MYICMLTVKMVVRYDVGSNVTITDEKRQVYQSVILKERKGEYLGKTVQVVPHITDEIQVRTKIQEISLDLCAQQHIIVTLEAGRAATNNAV